MMTTATAPYVTDFSDPRQQAAAFRFVSAFDPGFRDAVAECLMDNGIAGTFRVVRDSTGDDRAAAVMFAAILHTIDAVAPSCCVVIL